MRSFKAVLLFCITLVLAGLMLYSGVSTADGGRPVPNPWLSADGGRPLPDPWLLADGGRPLPDPWLVADGGRPLPDPWLSGIAS